MATATNALTVFISFVHGVGEDSLGRSTRKSTLMSPYHLILVVRIDDGLGARLHEICA